MNKTQTCKTHITSACSIALHGKLFAVRFLLFNFLEPIRFIARMSCLVFSNSPVNLLRLGVCFLRLAPTPTKRVPIRFSAAPWCLQELHTIVVTANGIGIHREDSSCSVQTFAEFEGVAMYRLTSTFISVCLRRALIVSSTHKTFTLIPYLKGILAQRIQTKRKESNIYA